MEKSEVMNEKALEIYKWAKSNGFYDEEVVEGELGCEAMLIMDSVKLLAERWERLRKSQGDEYLAGRLIYPDAPVQVRHAAIQILNIVSEAVELWEAEEALAGDEPCDKNVKLTRREEECADLAIRTFDYCAHRNVPVGHVVDLKQEYNGTRAFRNGGKKA